MGSNHEGFRSAELRGDAAPAGLPDIGAGRPTMSAGHGFTALSWLFRTHYKQLLRFCGIRLQCKADAEDIVQSAFMAAARAYPDKGIDELRPLLFALVRNHAINHLKSGDSRRRQVSSEIGEVADYLACRHTPTPETQAMDAQSLAVVKVVMEAMPERQSEALRLHRIEGLTYDEIARRLSVSRTTVKGDVARAVTEISEALARADRPAPGPAE